MKASGVLGTLRSTGGRGVVRIEDRYATDIDDLWSALTDPGRLARWFGQVQGDLRVGGVFSLDLGPDGQRAGRIEVCDPPRQLLVTMRETDESWQKGHGVPPFDARTEVTLTADGDDTVLVVEVRGMPLDKIAFYGAGWQIHAENLAAYLRGSDRGDTEARWGELVALHLALAGDIS